MEIAFLHPKYPGAGGNGASVHATKFLSVLESIDDTEITVYCLEKPPDHEIEVEGIYHEHLALPKPPYQIHQRLNNAVVRKKDEFREYDIIHSQISGTLPSIAKIGSEINTATIVTLHEYSQICPKSIGTFRFMGRTDCSSNGPLKCLTCSVSTLPSLRHADGEYNYLYRLASRTVRCYQNSRVYNHFDGIDRFHVLSPHMKSKYVEFGYPESQFSIVPDIIDEEFLNGCTTGFDEPFELLYVGRLDERKGVRKLVPMMERVIQEISSDVHLTIVGSGGAAGLINEQLSKSLAADSITLAGFVSDERLMELYELSDVFVYPGDWDEPFGVVFLEALGMGLPIVASDVGAIEGIIGDAGIVTEPSVEGLSNGVIQLLEGETLEERSAAAVERANRYRAVNIKGEIEMLYESIFP